MAPPRDYRAYARRFDGRRILAHECENEIEIVDHEIENDRHVGAARTELRQAMRLDELRLRVIRAECAKSFVKPLDMPDLQHQLFFAREFHEFLALGRRSGNGLF